MTYFYKPVPDNKFIYLQQMHPVNLFNRIVSSNFIATTKCLTEVNASKLSSSSLSRNHSLSKRSKPSLETFETFCWKQVLNFT